MDCSLPGSSVLVTLQERILEWITVLTSRESFQPRDQTQVSCCSYIAGRFFTTEPLAKLLIYKWSLKNASHRVVLRNT